MMPITIIATLALNGAFACIFYYLLHSGILTNIICAFFMPTSRDHLADLIIFFYITATLLLNSALWLTILAGG